MRSRAGGSPVLKAGDVKGPIFLHGDQPGVVAAPTTSCEALRVLPRFLPQICGRPSPLIQPEVLRGGTCMEWAEAKPGIWGKKKFMFLLKSRLTWDAKKCLNPAVQAAK